MIIPQFSANITTKDLHHLPERDQKKVEQMKERLEKAYENRDELSIELVSYPSEYPNRYLHANISFKTPEGQTKEKTFPRYTRTTFLPVSWSNKLSPLTREKQNKFLDALNYPQESVKRLEKRVKAHIDLWLSVEDSKTKEN